MPWPGTLTKWWRPPPSAKDPLEVQTKKSYGPVTAESESNDESDKPKATTRYRPPLPISPRWKLCRL